MRTFIIIFFILSPVSMASQNVITLEECYKKAENRHPAYSNYSVYDKQSDANLRNIKTVYLPQFKVELEAKYLSDVTHLDLNLPPQLSAIKFDKPSNEQYKAYLSINQMIYDGGVSSVNKSIVNSNNSLMKSKTNVTLYKTRDRVNSLYFSTLILNQNIKILSTMQEVLNENKKVVISGVKNGVALESDLDLVESELLKLDQQKSEVEIMKSALIRALSEVIGEVIPDNIKIEIPDIELSGSDIYMRPEFKLFELQKSMADLHIKQLKTDLRPKAYGFGQAGYGKPGLNMLEDELTHFYIVGVAASWTIFDWKQSKRKRQVLELQKELIENQSKELKYNIDVSLENTKGEISRYEKLIEKDKKLIGLLESIANRSSSQLKNGVVKTSDYLKDFNAVVKAKLAMETHKIQLVQQKSNYIYISGSSK